MDNSPSYNSNSFRHNNLQFKFRIKYINKNRRKFIHTLDELNKISMAINERASVSFSICYKATLDGDSPETFRKLCANTSPLLFLIETVDG